MSLGVFHDLSFSILSPGLWPGWWQLRQRWASAQCRGWPVQCWRSPGFISVLHFPANQFMFLEVFLLVTVCCSTERAGFYLTSLYCSENRASKLSSVKFPSESLWRVTTREFNIKYLLICMLLLNQTPNISDFLLWGFISEVAVQCSAVNSAFWKYYWPFVVYEFIKTIHNKLVSSRIWTIVPTWVVFVLLKKLQREANIGRFLFWMFFTNASVYGNILGLFYIILYSINKGIWHRQLIPSHSTVSLEYFHGLLWVSSSFPQHKQQENTGRAVPSCVTSRITLEQKAKYSHQGKFGSGLTSELVGGAEY